MNEKPTIQIVLPVMPNPKDFETLHPNPSNRAGLFQMALTAWEKACQTAMEHRFTFTVGERSDSRPEPTPAPAPPAPLPKDHETKH